MPTPFMSLPVPQVLTTRGPDYATQIDQSLTLLDSHDHTSGKGVAIPISALNVNADLTLGNFNVSQLRAARLQNQAMSLSLPLDVTSVYAMAGDLYYNNAANVPVRITAGNSLNAASVGGIGGDYSTSSASATYSSPSTTFSFFSAPSVYANMAQGNTLVSATNPTLTLASILKTGTWAVTNTTISVTDTTNTRPLWSYQSATTTGNPGTLTLGPNNATDPMPTLIGAAASYAVVDGRAPAQVATHGSNTESYVSANKDSALGLGLGYLNATTSGAGKISGTAGVLRMFTTDSLYFATQNTVAGVMDNNGNWGFSGGSLISLASTARVHVFANASQDGLFLDTPSGNASQLAMGANGTVGWRFLANSIGPLTVIDASGSNQTFTVPGLVSTGAMTSTSLTTPGVITAHGASFSGNVNISSSGNFASVPNSFRQAYYVGLFQVSSVSTGTQYYLLPYVNAGLVNAGTAMPFAGSLVGLSCVLSYAAAFSGSTMRLDVIKNYTTTIASSAVFTAGSSGLSTIGISFAKGAYPVAVGDILAVAYTRVSGTSTSSMLASAHVVVETAP